MVSKKVVIINKMGIHARPAAMLAKAAMQCRSNVKLCMDGKMIDPKDIMALMAAMIPEGAEVEIIADGIDEEKDLETLVGVLENGLE